MKEIIDQARAFLLRYRFIEPHDETIKVLDHLPNEQFEQSVAQLSMKIETEGWSADALPAPVPRIASTEEQTVFVFPADAQLAEVVVYLLLALSPFIREEVRQLLYEPYSRWHDVFFYYKEDGLHAYHLIKA